MYLTIITLPLLGSIAAGLLGRKVGVTGAQLITTSLVIITTLLAVTAFFEVGINSIPEKGSGKSLKRVKLSNSGDPLKLLIPSYIWKVISGWTNHSCKVKSQKMPEKKMGNRGSKSVVCKNAIVKEQRVYGSWCIKLMHLRCTLTGFERNYQVKNPSNQINKRNSYSSSAIQSQINSNLLNANFVPQSADNQSTKCKLQIFVYV